MAEQTTQEMLDEVGAALIDVLSGNSAWHDIQYNTGLSAERCVEIEALFEKVLRRYNQRHNIKD